MSELLPDDLPDNVRVTSVTDVMAAMSSGALLTVCFDLDGSLVDSRAAFTESLNEALHEHGLPTLPATSLYRYIGPPLRPTLVEVVDELLGDPDDVDAILATYRRHYRHASLRLSTRVPGIRSALNALDVWARVGVVTSKALPLAMPVIDAVGLRKQIAFVEGPSLEATAETKTETLARALDRWGSGDVTVMVGDRAEDIEAGRANDAVTVGVTWGIGDEAELRGAGADHVLTAPDQLPDLLRTIRADASAGADEPGPDPARD